MSVPQIIHPRFNLVIRQEDMAAGMVMAIAPPPTGEIDKGESRTLATDAMPVDGGVLLQFTDFPEDPLFFASPDGRVLVDVDRKQYEEFHKPGTGKGKGEYFGFHQELGPPTAEQLESNEMVLHRSFVVRISASRLWPGMRMVEDELAPFRRTVQRFNRLTLDVRFTDGSVERFSSADTPVEVALTREALEELRKLEDCEVMRTFDMIYRAQELPADMPSPGLVKPAQPQLEPLSLAL